ncbi:MAG: SemiSWEET family sugar transporter [Nitrospira sp.]|nr:SemiSWEET family sugar transporter [Nitrospira sp.]
MDGVTTLGLTAGTLTTIAFIPQIVKARQSKSTGDLSWGMVTIFSTGVLLWLIYGIWIDSLPVILANAVTLLLQCGIIALKIRYG